MEYKQFKLEVKVPEEDGKGSFEGYGNVFNIVDQGGDLVKPEAFNKTLDSQKIRPFFYLHDMNQPLGLVDLSTDHVGLKTSGTFNLGIQAAKEKYEWLKQAAEKGLKLGLSIGYKVLKDAYETIQDKKIRILKEVKLYEVSLVPYPMNQESMIESVKSREEESEIDEVPEGIDFDSQLKSLLKEPHSTPDEEPKPAEKSIPFVELLKQNLKKEVKNHE